MELWVRSQDKEILVKVNNLSLIFSNKDETCEIINSFEDHQYWELGTYKSKERALEVLNEIQEHLLKMGENEILTDKIGIMNGIKHYGIIYEMPKE